MSGMLGMSAHPEAEVRTTETSLNFLGQGTQHITQTHMITMMHFGMTIELLPTRAVEGCQDMISRTS